MGSALNSRALNRTWRNAGAMRNPVARAQLAAGAAMAGWSFGRGRGWWQHSNGGYGWVGPLFWPFAYFDIYDYTLWGNRVGAPFWGYGYDDIYAGVFAPYSRDDLYGYLPPRAADAPNAVPDRLAQMCGEDSRDVAGLQIERIQQTIETTEAQRAALDELTTASVTAAQGIRAACPTKVSLTAPSSACDDATAHRGDDHRGGNRAAAARKVLWLAGRRAEGPAQRSGRGAAKARQCAQPRSVARAKL